MTAAHSHHAGPAAALARVAAATALGSGLTTLAAYHLFASERSQLAGPFPFAADTNRRVVALTFDDGPNPPWTQQLAQVLRRHQVKATFFQPGACAARFPDITRQLVADGHVIGNHSYHHDIRRLWRAHDIRDEIERTQDVLAPLIGGAPALYRPPFLFRPPVLFDQAERLGMQLVGGVFCHPAEVRQPSPTALARSAERRAQPGRILIFHDGYNTTGAPRRNTIAAVDALIPRLRHAGYDFATVDQLSWGPRQRNERQPQIVGHPSTVWNAGPNPGSARYRVTGFSCPVEASVSNGQPAHEGRGGNRARRGDDQPGRTDVVTLELG